MFSINSDNIENAHSFISLLYFKANWFHRFLHVYCLLTIFPYSASNYFNHFPLIFVNNVHVLLFPVFHFWQLIYVISDYHLIALTNFVHHIIKFCLSSIIHQNLPLFSLINSDLDAIILESLIIIIILVNCTQQKNLMVDEHIIFLYSI
jgi:hypothetical protein